MKKPVAYYKLDDLFELGCLIYDKEADCVFEYKEKHKDQIMKNPNNYRKAHKGDIKTSENNEQI